MDQDTYDIIEDLKKFYADDEDMLRTVGALKSKFTEIEYKKAMRENPAIVELCELLVKKAKPSLAMLLAPSAATDKQLIAAEISVVWARFFLMALGEDPSKADESVRNIIRNHAKRAGITSKEE